MTTTQMLKAISIVAQIRCGKAKQRLNTATLCVILALYEIDKNDLPRENMTALAHRAGISTAAITGTRDRLLAMGLVCEDEDTDRRTKFLKLTDYGFSTVGDIARAIVNI